MNGYEQYNQMASNFGSSFQPEEGEEIVEHEVTSRSLEEIRSNDLVPTQPDHEVIQDQEYVRTELKADIELLGDVTETLRMDLKQGSKPNEFEAFVKLMKERREHLREYKEVNREIAELETGAGITKDAPQGGTVTNNTLVLTGNEAFDMILAARDKENGLDPDKEVR